MVDVQSILVKNIKKLRKQMKWTQAKLAEECDLSLNFVGKIESKLTFPSSDTLNKLVKAFKIHPYELFIDDEGFDTIKEVELYDQYSKHVIEVIEKDLMKVKREQNIS